MILAGLGGIIYSGLNMIQAYDPNYFDVKVKRVDLGVREFEEQREGERVKIILEHPEFVGQRLLLTRYRGEYLCIAAKNETYGRYLEESILIADKIIFPHNLTYFSMRTGYPEEGVEMNCLRAIKVLV